MNDISTQPQYDHGNGRPLTRFTGVSALALALTIAGLLVSSLWIKTDARFKGAVVLSAAARLIMEQAYTAPSPSEMFEAAATGLTAVLDPFSGYMPPTVFDWFTEDTEGEYVGIGLEITQTAGELVVVHVFPRTPASEAMIRPGDRIIAIDSTSLAGKTPAFAAELMRGPVGTEVDVEILRRDGETRLLHLIRDEVEVTPFPVAGITRSGIAYVRWLQFTDGSSDQFAALLEDLNVQEPVGLILDLRGNPGGLLYEAVSAAGLFLPEDVTVCRLANRDRSLDIDYRTSAGRLMFSEPVVIVCDESSASAAEILAAALWDYGRAVIVGARSFGKGWVQSVYPIGEFGALRLSTARYYTPSGRSLGSPSMGDTLPDGSENTPWEPGSGIQPDIIVEKDEPGPWETALSRSGVFSEFANVVAGDAIEEGSGDRELLALLREWSDSLDVEPESQAAGLIDALNDTTVIPRRLQVRTALPRQFLKMARVEDADLLFEREGQRLLLRVWEERLLAEVRPDPVEIETLLDLDPALATARDLVEEPERYRALAVPHLDTTVAAYSPDTAASY